MRALTKLLLHKVPALPVDDLALGADLLQSGLALQWRPLHLASLNCFLTFLSFFSNTEALTLKSADCLLQTPTNLSHSFSRSVIRASKMVHMDVSLVHKQLKTLAAITLNCDVTLHVRVLIMSGVGSERANRVHVTHAMQIASAMCVSGTVKDRPVSRLAYSLPAASFSLRSFPLIPASERHTLGSISTMRSAG
jgi:hypothetical protein